VVGFAVFEKHGPEFSFLVRDPDNHPVTADLYELFAHGVLLTAALRLPLKPYGLPGTQVIGGGVSSSSYTVFEALHGKTFQAKASLLNRSQAHGRITIISTSRGG
jgi:hypothetical protein